MALIVLSYCGLRHCCALWLLETAFDPEQPLDGIPIPEDLLTPHYQQGIEQPVFRETYLSVKFMDNVNSLMVDIAY